MPIYRPPCRPIGRAATQAATTGGGEVGGEETTRGTACDLTVRPPPYTPGIAH